MKKLLLLGGSTQQVPAIEFAKKKGHHVILCDYLSNNPGRQFADEYYCIVPQTKKLFCKLLKKIK